MIYFILTLPLKMMFYPIKYLFKFLKFLIDIFKELFPKNYYLEQLDNMSGLQFEEASKNILTNNGFYDVKVTKGSGDFGVDILAKNKHKKYAIQCKNYSGNVGVSAIQEAFSGCRHYSCDVAVVFTNSYFTKQAIELAKSIGVELWDRNTLKKMCKKKKIKTSSYNISKENQSSEQLIMEDAKDILNKIDYYNNLISNEKSLYKTVECQMKIYELCKQLEDLDKVTNGKIGLSTSSDQVLFSIKSYIKNYVNEFETQTLYINNKTKEIEEFEKLSFELMSIKNTFPILKEYVDKFTNRLNLYSDNLNH